jgi:tetratricopeptide (TPR) repeat protein
VLRTVLVTILFIGSSVALAQAAGGRVALVVGVSKYEHAARLPNTLNDAKDMSAALKRLDFDVDTVLDPSRSELEAAIRRYGDGSAGAEASVFYYSGHALEAGGHNWILPATANINSERDLRFEAVDLSAILEQADGAARVSIAFLDACRDNPFAGRISASGRGLSRGLERIELSTSGVLVAFSTAPGQIALDGVSDKKNSPFTAALLSHLETAGLEVKSLLSRVTKDVVEGTKGRQRPWQNSSLEGDFYFVPPPTHLSGQAVSGSGGTEQLHADIESQFWNSIKSSNNPAELEAYLTKFPNGAFVELARIRLAALQSNPQRENADIPLSQSGACGARPVVPFDPLPAEPCWEAPREIAKGGDAANKVSAATELNTKAALTFVNSGNAYRNRDDYDRAIADYTEAIRLDPSLASAYVSRGILRYSRKSYDDAIADYTEAARIDPNHAYIYRFDRGMAYRDKKDYDRAIIDFNEAIRLDPKYIAAYFGRGSAYRGKKEYDPAIADYTEAIRLDPNVGAYFVRGTAYRDKKDYDRAIADYTEAIRLSPEYAYLYLGRGTAYRSKKDYDRAIADYTEAIRLSPEDVDAYTNRGLANLDKKQFDRAIADFDEAVRIKPEYAFVYSIRGLAYHGKKDYDRAIADYSEAIRLDPNLTMAVTNRANAYRDKAVAPAPKPQKH